MVNYHPVWAGYVMLVKLTGQELKPFYLMDFMFTSDGI